MVPSGPISTYLNDVMTGHSASLLMAMWLVSVATVPVVWLRHRNQQHLPSLIVFQVLKLRSTPVRASYCGYIFSVKSFQSMYYLTDSCMKVRCVLLWLLCLCWHGCTFPSTTAWKLCVKKKKLKKKRSWPGFVKVLGKITIDCFRNHY